jgi:hypothetical protein
VKHLDVQEAQEVAPATAPPRETLVGQLKRHLDNAEMLLLTTIRHVPDADLALLAESGVEDVRHHFKAEVERRMKIVKTP